MTIGTIDSIDVRDVLRQLSFDSTAERTPLCELSLVRRSLLRNGFGTSRDARRFEVGRILSEVIESELQSLRGGNGAAGKTASERIRCDFGAGHRDLEAWSAIYYLYVRTDLNIGLRDFERILGDRHRRTIQRRLRRGVGLLTSRLQAMERVSVAEERHARLMASLPAGPSRPLLGRSEHVASIRKALAGKGTDFIVALTGTSGVGKSSIARAVASQLAAEAEVERVFWVRANGIAAQCLVEGDALCRTMAREAADTTEPAEVARTLAYQPCLIIVDGVDDIATAEASVAALAALPATATLLMTGRVRFNRFRGVSPVEVGPLRPDAALELLRQETHAHGISEVGNRTTQSLLPIVAATAGHPAALCEAARQLRALDVERVADDFACGQGAAGVFYASLWETSYTGAGFAVREVIRSVIAARRLGVQADRDTILARTDLGGGALASAICHAVDLGMLVPLGSLHRRHYDTALFLDRYVANLDRLEDGPIDMPSESAAGCATSSALPAHSPTS